MRHAKLAAVTIAVSQTLTVIPCAAQGIMETGGLYGGIPRVPGGGINAGIGAQNAGRGIMNIGGYRPGQSTNAASGTKSRARVYVDPEEARAAGLEANKVYLQAKQKDKEGKYAEAEKLYGQSLSIRERVWGDTDPAVSEIYDRVATIYKKQHKLAQAEWCYRRMLSAGARRFGPGRPEVCPVLVNLVDVCLDQGKHADAYPALKQLLALDERFKGIDSADTMRSRYQLAHVCTLIGKDAEAEPLFKQNLELYQKNGDNKSSAYATFISAYASFLKDSGRTAEADEMNARIAALKEAANVDSSGSAPKEAATEPAQAATSAPPNPVESTTSTTTNSPPPAEAGATASVDRDGTPSAGATKNGAAASTSDSAQP